MITNANIPDDSESPTIASYVRWLCKVDVRFPDSPIGRAQRWFLELAELVESANSEAAERAEREAKQRQNEIRRVKRLRRSTAKGQLEQLGTDPFSMVCTFCNTKTVLAMACLSHALNAHFKDKRTALRLLVTPSDEAPDSPALVLNRFKVCRSASQKADLFTDRRALMDTCTAWIDHGSSFWSTARSCRLAIKEFRAKLLDLRAANKATEFSLDADPSSILSRHRAALERMNIAVKTTRSFVETHPELRAEMPPIDPVEEDDLRAWDHALARRRLVS